MLFNPLQPVPLNLNVSAPTRVAAKSVAADMF